MSSKNNVNPGQYTARGSQRQGEDVIHSLEQNEYAQASSPEPSQRSQQNLIPAAKSADKEHKEDKEKKAERKSTKKPSAKR